MTLNELKKLYSEAQQEQQPDYENYEAACHAIYKAFPDLVAAAEGLRDLLCEMSDPICDDPRIDYEERQITKGEVEKARAILGRLGHAW